MRSRHNESFHVNGMRRAGTSALVCLVAGSLAWAQAANPPLTPAAPPAAAAVTTSPAGATQGTPKYRCDEPTYNFPDVWSGEEIKHEFVIHNDGDANLEILEARPGCGCTVAEFDKVIPPGKQGKVRSALRTRGFNSEVTKPINLRTNDPKNPQPILQLKGKIKARVAMDPPTGAQFGKVGKDTALTKTVRVTNNTDAPLKLQVAPALQNSIFTTELKEVEAGKVYDVIITANRPFKDGTNFSQVTLKTGIESEPDLFIPANLYAAPLVEVAPAAIAVATPVASELRRQVMLTYNGEGKMKIIEVKSTDPKIKAEFEEVKPVATAPAGSNLPTSEGRMYRVNVTIAPGYEPAPAAPPAEIVVTTDVQAKPEVRVRVQAYPQRPQTPQVVADSLIGKPSPRETAKNSDGQDVKIGEPGDKVSVVTFWTSWCPHCKRLLPTLQRIAQTYTRKGVDFTLVSLDQTAPADQVLKVVKDLGITLPIVVDAKQAIGGKFGANRFPMTFVLNKTGVIEAIHHGNAASIETDIKTQLDLLLEGKTRADFPKKAPTAVAESPNQATATRPAAAAPTSPNPTLVVDSLKQDVGMFKPGAAGKFNLYLRNGGAQPLNLVELKPSDGLKIDPSAPKVVAGGASAAIPCEFTAPRQPGPFQHSVAITSNDAAKPSVTVTLTGTTRSLIEVDPPAGVDFGRRPATFSMDRMTTLVWNGEGAVKFVGAESSNPKFEATVQPIRQGPNAMVIVRAKAPFEMGENKAKITIKTDCKEQPTVEVPVTLFQPTRIEILPAAVTVPKLPRMQEAMVSITNNGTEGLNVLAVKASSQKIRTQFYPEPDGMSYKLKLILMPGFAVSPDGEKVTIRTDDKEYGEIVIPIKVAETPEAARSVSVVP